MMTFLAAGNETTSPVLTWAVDLLANQSGVQRLLPNEVDASQLPSLTEAPPQSSLSSASCSVTAKTMNHMPYLNAFIRETLRLSSPVSITIHTANKHTDIYGHFTPKGTTAISPPWAVKTGPKLWDPHAREFTPER